MQLALAWRSKLWVCAQVLAAWTFVTACWKWGSMWAAACVGTVKQLRLRRQLRAAGFDWQRADGGGGWPAAMWALASRGVVCTRDDALVFR